MDKTGNGLIPDPNGVELCFCNNCYLYLIDHNSKRGAKTYDASCADGELRQFTDHTSHDIQYFWGCPECKTDDYLTDVLMHIDL